MRNLSATFLANKERRRRRRRRGLIRVEKERKVKETTTEEKGRVVARAQVLLLHFPSLCDRHTQAELVLCDDCEFLAITRD